MRAQVEEELAEEHTRIAGGIDRAVEIGVVEPSATRNAIAEAGLVARGHHTKIPL